MTNIVEIGKLIKETRKEKKISQSELAQRAEVSRNTIEAIENARVPEAGLMLILRIMHALDLDLHHGTYNAGRPTLEQLHREEEEANDAPRMGR